MRTVTWLLWLAVFLVLVGFAAKNLDPVTLHFYLGYTWKAPLVLLLLAAFAVGAVLGVLAMSGALLRQRREISRLRRETRRQQSRDAQPGGGAPAARPPAVDA